MVLVYSTSDIYELRKVVVISPSGGSTYHETLAHAATCVIQLELYISLSYNLYNTYLRNILSHIYIGRQTLVTSLHRSAASFVLFRWNRLLKASAPF